MALELIYNAATLKLFSGNKRHDNVKSFKYDIHPRLHHIDDITKKIWEEFENVKDHISTIGGAGNDLQNALDLGSTATIAKDMSIDVGGASILVASKTSRFINSAGSNSAGLSMDSTFASIRFNDASFGERGSVEVGSNSASLLVTDGSNYNSISLESGGMTIQDSQNEIGLVYRSTNYRANFVDLSLVDKGYVDAQIAGLGTVALVGTYNSGYVPRWNATTNTLESGSIQDNGTNVAIGTTPSSGLTLGLVEANASVNDILYITDTSTNTSGTMKGINVNIDAANTNNYATNVIATGASSINAGLLSNASGGSYNVGVYGDTGAGIDIETDFTAFGISNVGTAGASAEVGLFGLARAQSGTSDKYGVFARAEHDQIGTITNAYALYSNGVHETSTGAIDNAYGLYLSTNSGNISNSYGIYQAGADDPNYFAGLSTFNKMLTIDSASDNKMRLGGSSTSGYIEYYNSLGTRRSYVGFTSATEFRINNESGGLVRIDGGEIILNTTNQTVTLDDNTIIDSNIDAKLELKGATTSNYIEYYDSVGSRRAYVGFTGATEFRINNQSGGLLRLDGGEIRLGSYDFDGTVVPTASEDGHVLTYDHSTGKIGLQAAGGGGSSLWTDDGGGKISYSASNPGVEIYETGFGNTYGAAVTIRRGVFLVGESITIGHATTATNVGRAAAFGGNHTIGNIGTSDYVFTAGYNNTIEEGLYNIALGGSNTIKNTSDSALAFGTNNTITGSKTIAIGDFNTLISDNAIAVGTKVKAGDSTKIQIAFGNSFDVARTFYNKGFYVEFGDATGTQRPSFGLVRASGLADSQPLNLCMGDNNCARNDGSGGGSANAGSGVFWQMEGDTKPTTSFGDAVAHYTTSRAAGKAGYEIRTEDGTQHYFGDYSAIGGDNTVANANTILTVQGEGTGTGYGLEVEDSAGSQNLGVRDDGVIVMANLPTSSAGLPTGALWNNSGVINIV